MFMQLIADGVQDTHLTKYNFVVDNIENYDHVNIMNNYTIILHEKMKKKINCCICIESHDLNIYKTLCGHMYCKNCIAQWLKNNNSCPSCRTTITLKKNITKQHTNNKNNNNENNDYDQSDALNYEYEIDRPTERELLFM